MKANIISLYHPTQEEPKILFLDVVREYSAKEIKLQRLKKSTAEKHGYFIANIERFLISTRQQGITVDEVSIKMINQMQYWLQTSLHQCKAGHASRHAKLCKNALSYAVRMEYLLSNPLSEIRLIRDKAKEVICLEPHELNMLMNRTFTGPIKVSPRAVDWVIDLYIFQAYTGLSYGDLYTFSIVKKNERPWIQNHRSKNSNLYYVPLFEQAKSILDKYNGKLPFVCLHYYNRVLKIVARAIGINKTLTTHTARKTFATHRDAEGWSTKTISDMMGNTLQVLQTHYLADSMKRTENELLRMGL